MKKSLLKNNLKSISKTRRRFISILVMAFLGVGFYAGLVATSPDMLDSLDKYADSSNLYDIEVISTLGLTDEDITAIKDINEIEDAYGIQTKDTMVEIDEVESICKVIEYNENINTPVLIKGEMPKNSNECVIDNKYLLTAEDQDCIGKTIIINNDDTNEDDTDVFTKKELTIVGIVESPLYISTQRGNTSIGSGSISFYIYVKDDVINLDYYTELYATVSGAKELVTNSDEYNQKINSAIEKIENIKEERENARYNQLVEEANKKLDDAQKEYDDKKAEVEQELADAQKKIDDAKAEITKSENTLTKSESDIKKQEQELEQQFTDAQSQIDTAEEQIKEKTVALENAKKQLESSGEEANPAILQLETEIAIATEQIQAQKDTLATTKQTAYDQITSAKAQISTGKEKLKTAKSELAQKEKEFEDGKEEANQKLADAQKQIDDARDEVAKIEKAKWYIQDRLDNSGYTNVFDAIKTMSNISKVFPLIFYLVAVLISLTSMTRMIEEERVEIGTLKSLGYTNWQIISKYILYASLACIIGGVIGMSIGFYLLPNIVWVLYSIIYTIPKFYTTYQLAVGLRGILIAFICIGGATIFVAYKELKEMPSVLMRPKPPKNGKRIVLERINFIWKRLNFSKKVTIRNIFRYKKRAIMTIVGIAGCTGLMLTGFGIRDSVVKIPTEQYGGIFKYEVSISLLNTDGINEIEQYAQNNENIVDYSKLYATSGTLKKDKKSYDITMFIPNDNDAFKNVCNLINTVNDEEVNLTDNGIIITDKVAEMLNVVEGEEVTLIDADNIEHNFKIDAVVKNYVSHFVYMSKDFYTQNIKSYDVNMLLVNVVDDTDTDKLAEDLLNIDGVSAVSNVSTLVATIDDMLTTMNYVVVILIVASALLAFVVLYNLANINIGERQREIATLKVLGFYDKEVDNYINKESIIFTLIGIILGLIFGTFLTKVIVASVEIDSLKFIINVKEISYVYSAIMTASFSFIVNGIIHFVLKKIDMIESLKSVE